MPQPQILASLNFKEDFKPLFILAIPLIVTGVIQSSVGFMQNIFLAQLGETSLAAGGLVTWLLFMFINLIFGTFNSVNVLVAHKYGESSTRDIPLILRDGLSLAILLVIPSFFLMWNMADIFSILGQRPEIASLAEPYLHALSWGLLPKFIVILLYELIIGLGHTRVSMMFSMMSVPMYLFFSYVLIFGKFGFPELNIAGAGWGVTCADWITAFILCTYVSLSPRYRHYIKSIFTLKKPFYFAEIIQLGAPMGAMFCIEVGFFFAMSLIMGWISISTLAANQLTMQYLGPLMGIIFCIAQAVTVRMSHQLGARNIYEAQRAAYAGIVISAILMLCIASCYWLFPYWLIAIDFDLSSDIQVITIAQQFLFIAGFFQIFEAIRISIFGALRALKDTRFTFLASAIGFWLIPLPLGTILYLFLHVDGSAFWYGMTIGALFNVILLEKRLRQKISLAKQNIRN